MDRGEQHPAGFDAHHGAGREIRDRHAGLADELFRLIERVNAGQDRARFSCAVVQRELQQLLGLRHCFTGKNLDSAEIALGEGLKVDEILEQRFDFHIAEVDLLFDGSRFFGFLRRLACLQRGAGFAGTFEIGGRFLRLFLLLLSDRLHGGDLESIVRQHPLTSYKRRYT